MNCDTIVAVPTATKEDMTLFGKNSDREPDEAQNLIINPRKTHGSNEKVKCTYIEIPQTSETYRTLLCKPFWMFGAEMGFNEHGVAIGNEALMTKVSSKDSGLTGMDLLRLTLERSRTAKEGRETLITLLETHGQGQPCGYRHKLYYMNSFIIADKDEAYVLETIEKNWAWKQIKNVWSISNKISIEQDYDQASPGLIEYAVRKGWCSTEMDFNFRKDYSDKFITWGAAGKNREQTNRKHLLEKKGTLTTQNFMNILRFHTDKPDWKPHQGLRMTVCAHAANNLTKATQTVCSLVAKIGKDNFNSYTTGSSNPCISPFFPIFAPITSSPENYVVSGEFYNSEHFWWNAEKLHRKVILNYLPSIEIIKPDIKKFEKKMIENVEASGKILNQEDIDNYFSQVNGMLISWENQIDKLSKGKSNIFFKHFWKKYNKLNRIN